MYDESRSYTQSEGTGSSSSVTKGLTTTLNSRETSSENHFESNGKSVNEIQLDADPDIESDDINQGDQKTDIKFSNRAEPISIVGNRSIRGQRTLLRRVSRERNEQIVMYAVSYFVFMVAWSQVAIGVSPNSSFRNLCAVIIPDPKFFSSTMIPTGFLILVTICHAIKQYRIPTERRVPSPPNVNLFFQLFAAYFLSNLLCRTAMFLFMNFEAEPEILRITFLAIQVCSVNSRIFYELALYFLDDQQVFLPKFWIHSTIFVDILYVAGSVGSNSHLHGENELDSISQQINNYSPILLIPSLLNEIITVLRWLWIFFTNHISVEQAYEGRSLGMTILVVVLTLPNVFFACVRCYAFMFYSNLNVQSVYINSFTATSLFHGCLAMFLVFHESVEKAVFRGWRARARALRVAAVQAHTREQLARNLNVSASGGGGGTSETIMLVNDDPNKNSAVTTNAFSGLDNSEIDNGGESEDESDSDFTIEFSSRSGGEHQSTVSSLTSASRNGASIGATVELEQYSLLGKLASVFRGMASKARRPSLELESKHESDSSYTIDFRSTTDRMSATSGATPTARETESVKSFESISDT